MSSFQQTQAPACTDCIAYQQHIKQLQEQLRQALATNKQLRARLQWEDKLFATPSEHMSDAEKIIARSLPVIVKEARARETTDTARDDGLTRVYLNEIADRTGKSARRIGPNLQRMADNQVIRREFQRSFNEEKGKPDNALFIDVTPALMQAAITALPGKEHNRGNGQKHFICKTCHSRNTQVRRVYEVICKDCGEIHLYDATKPEDKAFIIDDETLEKWDDWYEDLGTRPEPPARPCMICQMEDWRWDTSAQNYYCGNRGNHDAA